MVKKYFSMFGDYMFTKHMSKKIRELETIKKEIRNLNLTYFPRIIDLEEGEELISYLAKSLPGIIDYHSSYSVSLNGQGKYTSKRGRTVNIKGVIHGPKRTADSFCLEHHPYETSKFRSLMFDLTPKWKLSDYDSGMRELWKDTRNLVEQYFKQDKLVTN